MFCDSHGRVLCLKCNAKMRLSSLLTEPDGSHIAHFECEACGHGNSLMLSPPSEGRAIPGAKVSGRLGTGNG